MIGILLGMAGAAAVIGYWIAAASYLYCRLSHHLDLFVAPYDQWLEIAPNWQATGWTEACVIAGAAGATLPLVGIGVALRRLRARRLTRPFGGGLHRIERGPSDNLGHAEWMTMQEARSLFSGRAGMVIGEDYQPSLADDGPFEPRNRRTWGKGGTAGLLIDPCNDGPTHSLEFSSPGGFKTSCAVTKLLHWPGSAVVLDVACELGPMLARDRRERGHRVVTIGFGPNDDGIDALGWIDPEAPGAVRRMLSMTASICGEEPQRAKDQIFDSAGRNIVACLLAAMLWSDLPQEKKNLVTLMDGISTPQDDMRHLLRGVRETSPSQLARHLAGTIMGLPDDTLGGAYFNATTLCSWLFDEANAKLLSGSVQASDLLRGGITVFVQTPIDSLTHTPGLGRVIIDAFVSAAIQADGAYDQRMLFLLDEAFRLGPMRSIEVARDQGRKFGITLAMLYQSEALLLEQWGKEACSKWFEAVSWRAYSSIQDLETAKAISEAVGKYAVLATSEGDNRGSSKPWGLAMGSRNTGSTQNVHEISRDLIRPEEVLNDMRSDEQIVFSRFGRPLRCGKPIWWRRPELLARVDENRFNKVLAE